MSTTDPLTVKVTYRVPPAPGTEADALLVDGKAFTVENNAAIPSVGDKVSLAVYRRSGVRGRYAEGLYQGERFTVVEVERLVVLGRASILRVDVTVHLEADEG